MSNIPPDVYDFVRQLGAVLCLLIFIFGLWKRWWVMGAEFERLEKECDALKVQAKADAETIQRAVHTTWQMVGTVRETVRPPQPPAGA